MNYIMYINKSKSKKILLTLSFLLILIYLLVFAKINFSLTKNIVNYWINTLIPSLFPFLLFSEILINTNLSYYFSKLFAFIPKHILKLPIKSVISIIIGFLCGYPNGAKSIILLYEQGDIDKSTANRLLSFLNNCNPIFILSSVGIGVFCDIYAGIALALSHYIAAIIIGIFSKSNKSIIHDNLEKANNNIAKKEKNIDNVGVLLKNSILNSFSTLVIIFGFIVIFNIIGKIFLIPLEYVFDVLNVGNKDIILTFIQGIFEMTTGITKLNGLNISYELKMCITSFFLSFSSLSVIFQIYVIIASNKFKLSLLFITKTIQGILSVIITYILINTFVIFSNPLVKTDSSIDVNAFTSLPQSVNLVNLFVMIISAIIIIMSIIQMIKISIKKSNKV